MITLVATDVPKTDWKKFDGDKMPKDKPKTDDDYFISVDLDMLEYYKAVGLNERYFPIFCFIRKLSNGIERKAYMTIFIIWLKYLECITIQFTNTLKS